MLMVLIPAMMAVLVYLPALDAEFIDYDDPLYVTENEWVLRGLSADEWQKTWTERVAGNWHPITMLSHQLDVTLYGLNPRGHHATSLLLHAINASLFYLLLLSLFARPGSALVAALLFALHPFNVDSVVWIAERKNVLSTFFWLVATLWYVRFTRVPSVTAMLAIMFSYLLGLMSKPMLVTFPLTLLLLDVWPLRRVQGFDRDSWSTWIKLIQEKSVLFLLTIIFSAFTLLTQFPQGNEHHPVVQPLWARCMFAVEHYRMYLEKFFWPVNFSVLYPRLEMPPDLQSVFWSGVILIIFTALALGLMRRKPAWALGWFWFIGTLFPVVGLVGIGQHSIADRYMYVPMMGLLIALVYGVPECSSRWFRGIRCVMAVGAIIACVWTTRLALPFWNNSEVLYKRAIDVTEGNYIMMSNLGRQYMLQDRTTEAIVLFQEAMALFPYHAPTCNNLGFALSSQGLDDEAINHYEAALALDPTYGTARINLARSLVKTGRIREALPHYEMLIKAHPESAEVRDGYRIAREKLGWSGTRRSLSSPTIERP